MKNKLVWKKLHTEEREEIYKKIMYKINVKIDFSKKFVSEEKFTIWFIKNYRLLGFSKILKHNKSGFPDFFMEFDKKIISIEIETLSSNFKLHHHDPRKCDFVICLKNNKKLYVKTIEIENFIHLRATSSLRINPDLWKKFKIYCIKNHIDMSSKMEKMIRQVLRGK